MSVIKPLTAPPRQIQLWLKRQHYAFLFDSLLDTHFCETVTLDVCWVWDQEIFVELSGKHWLAQGRIQMWSTGGTCPLQTHGQRKILACHIFTTPLRRSPNHLVGWETGKTPPQTFPPQRLRQLKSNVPLPKQFFLDPPPWLAYCSLKCVLCVLLVNREAGPGRTTNPPQSLKSRSAVGGTLMARGVAHSYAPYKKPVEVSRRHLCL